MKRHIALPITIVCIFALFVALAGFVGTGYASTAIPTLPTRAVRANNKNAKAATVLIYVNGSDLESEAGEATADIDEMLKSKAGNNVNVVLQTMGTREWQGHNIASDHSQRYIVRNGSLELVDDTLGQLDVTAPETLSDFIAWGTANYPADRYFLILWNHGAGPVYGFGYDDTQASAYEDGCYGGTCDTDTYGYGYEDYGYDYGYGDAYGFGGPGSNVGPGANGGPGDFGYGDTYDFGGNGGTTHNRAECTDGTCTTGATDAAEYEALTLDEMQQALKANSQVHFDFIGMDCCIMSSLETCQVLAPYCDYTILSEDFEPGVGWSYTNWLNKLEENPAISTTDLGTVIVDDMIADSAADEENGDATLALIDESKVNDLYNAWIKFAYAHESDLLENNYSTELTWRGRPSGPSNMNEGPGMGNGYGDQFSGMMGDMMGNEFGGMMGGPSGSFGPWDYDNSYVTMTDYYATDIMEAANSLNSTEANDLKAALQNAIVHFGQTEGEEGMSGIGVTLPYGDSEFYNELVKVFTASGIDNDYVQWLEKFVSVDNTNASYDYGTSDSNEFGFGHENGGFGQETNGFGHENVGFGYEDFGANMPWAA